MRTEAKDRQGNPTYFNYIKTRFVKINLCFLYDTFKNAFGEGKAEAEKRKTKCQATSTGTHAILAGLLHTPKAGLALRCISETDGSTQDGKNTHLLSVNIS